MCTPTRVNMWNLTKDILLLFLVFFIVMYLCFWNKNTITVVAPNFKNPINRFSRAIYANYAVPT